MVVQSNKHQANLIDILEMATKIMSKTFIYNKNSNFTYSNEFVDSNIVNADKIIRLNSENLL